MAARRGTTACQWQRKTAQFWRLKAAHFPDVVGAALPASGRRARLRALCGASIDVARAVHSIRVCPLMVVVTSLLSAAVRTVGSSGRAASLPPRGLRVLPVAPTSCGPVAGRLRCRPPAARVAGDDPRRPGCSRLALAHVNSDRVEAAYRRSDRFEKRRALMDEWAAYISGA